MCEDAQREGSVAGGVEFKINGVVADPSKLLNAWVCAAVLHGIVERIVRVEVAHALEVERFGPWLLDFDIFQVGLGYTVLCIGALLLVCEHATNTALA